MPITLPDGKTISGAIKTFTGDYILPLDPDPANIHIEDIAHALSNNCRFTGHVKTFYSVGQHSVLASYIVEAGHELTALLHDASEAYLSDFARPIKQQPGFGDLYREVEEKLMLAIAEKFGIIWPMPSDVKLADNILLVTEARDLMHGTDDWAPEYQDIPKLDETIVSWLPEEVEMRFLDRYNELS